MQTAKDPAKSRPLSANVKRLMRLSRSSPANRDVMQFGREFTVKDLASCHKQGCIFMEAASMGLPMEDFAPMFMTSQLAGILDVSFSTSNDITDLLKIPMLLKDPGAVVEALYWIDDIVSRAEDTDNKSLLVSRAYGADTLRLPPVLEELTENRDVGDLMYAYWLGYIYRCECLLHEESSRMVYGAFPEKVMHSAYKSLSYESDLSECAVEICEELDRFLVEVLWKDERKQKSRPTESKTSKINTTTQVNKPTETNRNTITQKNRPTKINKPTETKIKEINSPTERRETDG